MLLIPTFPAGILFTGELWEFLSFTERYPSIIYNILLFGLTSALGQVSFPRCAAFTGVCLHGWEMAEQSCLSFCCFGCCCFPCRLP